METVNDLKVWLEENRAAPSWHHDNVPAELDEELRKGYHADPAAFKQAVLDFGEDWELMELRDNDTDTHAWFAMVNSPFGSVSVYSNREIFAQMGESINQFTKANETWYGRLWLRFIFWVHRNKIK